MTCFRLKDGTTVHSKTNSAQYAKFLKLAEEGVDTDEAYKESIRDDRKKRKAADAEAKRILDEKTYMCVIQRMYRSKCSFKEAFMWAKDTGRLSRNAEAALIILKRWEEK